MTINKALLALALGMALAACSNADQANSSAEGAAEAAADAQAAANQTQDPAVADTAQVAADDAAAAADAANNAADAANDAASAAAGATPAINPHREARLAALAAEMDRKQQRIRDLQAEVLPPKMIPAYDRPTDAEAAQVRTQYEEALQGLEVTLGKRTITDVLNAQSNTVQARRNLDQSRYDVLLKTLQLKQQAGTLGPDDLAAIDQLLTPAS